MLFDLSVSSEWRCRDFTVTRRKRAGRHLGRRRSHMSNTCAQACPLSDCSSDACVCVCVCLYKNDASQILICMEGFIVLVMAHVSWKRTVEVEQRGEDRRPEAGIDWTVHGCVQKDNLLCLLCLLSFTLSSRQTPSPPLWHFRTFLSLVFFFFLISLDGYTFTSNIWTFSPLDVLHLHLLVAI